MTIIASKPTELTPLLGQTHKGTASTLRTYGNIVISIVGAGVLGLPYTFKVGGWAVGATDVIIAALLSYYCMLLLVRCRRKLVQDGRHDICTYSDLGYETYGNLGRQVVDILVVVSQSGCCVSYLIFIGQNLSSLFYSTTSRHAIFILLLLPVEAILSCVRSLASLAPFSIFADICNVLAMTIVIKDDLHSFSGLTKVNAYTNWRGVPFAMGVAIFCYEGFGMTLALEASMRDPKRFARILGLAFTFITSVYVTFGIIGYLAFGEETEDIITLNLPNNWTTGAVKAGLCIALVFTFPVMMYPVHEIFERKLLLSEWFQEQAAASPRLHDTLLRLMRGILVVVIALVAVSIPGFGAFISLVGSTVCAMLAFVLPALFHLQVFKERASPWERLVDHALVVGGVTFSVYGTYSASSELFHPVSLVPDNLYPRTG